MFAPVSNSQAKSEKIAECLQSRLFVIVETVIFYYFACTASPFNTSGRVWGFFSPQPLPHGECPRRAAGGIRSHGSHSQLFRTPWIPPCACSAPTSSVAQPAGAGDGVFLPSMRPCCAERAWGDR